MTIAAPPPGLQQEDFEDIEAAVMETARGRWFLTEYARRARAEDTQQLRETLNRIAMRLDALGAPPKAEAVPIIDRLERLVWSLRESGVEDYVCSKIERLTRDLAANGVTIDAPAQPQTPAVAFPEPELRRDESIEESTVYCVLQATEPMEQGKIPSVEPERDVAVFQPSPPLLGMEPASSPEVDPRLQALVWLDQLPLLDRVALFA